MDEQTAESRVISGVLTVMWAAALVGFGLFDIGEWDRIGYWVGTAFSAVLAASVSIGAAQAFARSHWKRLRSPGVGSRRLYTRGCVLGLFTIAVGAAGVVFGHWLARVNYSSSRGIFLSLILGAFGGLSLGGFVGVLIFAPRPRGDGPDRV